MRRRLAFFARAFLRSGQVVTGRNLHRIRAAFKCDVRSDQKSARQKKERAAGATAPGGRGWVALSPTEGGGGGGTKQSISILEQILGQDGVS